jgi:protein-disulfide isomerase-like protein with CxxC motif
MHFHLPKPLHGWRAFAGEVGIIVVGVLIALAAEQVVQTIHGRQEVVELRDALDGAARGTLAEAEFSAARALGVHAFPTVLLVEGDRVQALSEGVPDPDRINAAIAAALDVGATA